MVLFAAFRMFFYEIAIGMQQMKQRDNLQKNEINFAYQASVVVCYVAA
jgi:hypothetical protein